MCGKEISGFENAVEDLFYGATFVLCATSKSTSNARKLVEELVQVIDAKPLWMEPEVHDAWAGATSHLPYILSLALVNATPMEFSTLIGPGFSSAARLAASDPKMMRDIMLTNQEEILGAIRRFQTKLENLEALVTKGSAEQLMMKFEDSHRRYQRLVMDREVE